VSLASPELANVIYTIRDHEGWVRYVGATTNTLRSRISGHYSAKTKIGVWLRGERDAGRRVEFVIEEHNKDPFMNEPFYINGYARLAPDKLMNQVHRPPASYTDAYSVRDAREAITK